MWGLIIALVSIFGGCCSNVLTLEGIMVGQTASIGNILTLCQFLFVTVESSFKFVHIRGGRPFLKPMKVPLRVYILSVLLYYISAITNNSVFMFGISVPLHIVFRCSGTVITMIICWLFTGRRYSKLQIFSAFLLTVGAIFTSLFKQTDFTWDNVKSMRGCCESVKSMDGNFLTGISLLSISSIASSSLSVYNEWTYKTYGKHWRENLFYTHALALPLFLLQYKQLQREFLALINSKNQLSFRFKGSHFTLTKEMLFMTNVVTQQICIRGVNILASKTNAITLSVVLLFRKFLSLLLSVALFGSEFSSTCYIGITLVFAGALLYSVAPAGSKSPLEEKSLNKNN